MPPSAEIIKEYAAKYRFTPAVSSELAERFDGPGAKNFKESFDGVFNALQNIYDNESLSVFLTLKVLTGFMTEEDAEAAAALAGEIPYPLHHYDILTLCRRPQAKTPSETAAELEAVLTRLSFAEIKEENLGAAVKVLLGKITEEEAASLAACRSDLKTKKLIESLAPGVLKKYLGTMPAEEIVIFFAERLRNYSFWKTDRAKHLYALDSLVAELNGTSSAEISRFVLNALEEGHELGALSNLLEKITPKEKLTITESGLRKSLPRKPDTREDGGSLASIFDE